MSAPRRLLEDPETAEALRTDLQAAATHQVNFDMTAGLARFEAALAQNAAAASTSGLKATLLKLGVAGIIGGAAVGVALYAGEDSKPAEPVQTAAPPAPAPVRPQQASKPLVQAPVPEEKPVPAAEEPVAAPKPQPAAAPKRAAVASERPAKVEAKPAPTQNRSDTQSRDDLLDQEVQQLRQIRQLAASNPARALAMANEGHVRFKGGVLYQEREALALQALSNLGRRSELQQRGERYLKAFPNGSFSNRVRQLLGR